MDDREFLELLGEEARKEGLPEPVDLRQVLPRHPSRLWDRRDVDGLEGMTFHQFLCNATTEQVAKFHCGPHSGVRKGGAPSLPYTGAIRPTGQFVLANDLAEKTWSHGTRKIAGDENYKYMAVALEGMFPGPGFAHKDAAPPTFEQLLAIRVLWRVCGRAWGWAETACYGHNHWGKPACPGYAAQDEIEAIRNEPVSWPVRDQTPEMIPGRGYSLAETTGRQQALIDLAFLKGAADGMWGPMSKGALEAFQEARRLEVDGVWGMATEREMVSALAIA